MSWILTVACGNRFPHLLEQPVLQVEDLFLGAEDLVLVFLQLRRDETFSIRKRLLCG